MPVGDPATVQLPITFECCCGKARVMLPIAGPLEVGAVLQIDMKILDFQCPACKQKAPVDCGHETDYGFMVRVPGNASVLWDVTGQVKVWGNAFFR